MNCVTFAPVKTTTYCDSHVLIFQLFNVLGLLLESLSLLVINCFGNQDVVI